MARPRTHPDNATRQAAYRERKRQELDVDPADLGAEPQPQIKSVVDPSSLPSLDSYVADAVFMAERHHAQASPNATDSTKDLAGAIERAEHYARWRYAGVLDGSINGL